MEFYLIYSDQTIGRSEHQDSTHISSALNRTCRDKEHILSFNLFIKPLVVAWFDVEPTYQWYYDTLAGGLLKHLPYKYSRFFNNLKHKTGQDIHIS